jgi:4'-phosphopantetheinyl transferase
VTVIPDNALMPVVLQPCGGAGPAVFLLKLAHPGDGEMCRQLEASCSTARRERAGRCRMADDTVRCLAAGWLVRHAAEQVLGKKGINESHEPDGRPFLPQAPGYGLSITHSGAWVACALHPGGPVGIDLELPPHIIAGMAETFMSPEELLLYRRCAGEVERIRFFLRHWCLKESWLKAAGTGLLRDPASVAVLPRDSVMEVRFGGTEYWHCSEKWLDDGALLTVCWK